MIERPSGSTYGTLTTADLHQRLGDSDLLLLDVRTMAAYNGWPMRGEARGGHLPGAVAFPRTWLSGREHSEVQRLLHAKGVSSKRNIVVYGDGAEDAAALAATLATHGVKDVRVYGAGFSAWAADENLPVERLPNYEKLVHPAWLRQLTDAELLEGKLADGHLLFHVNFGGPEEYEDSHLPGALYLDTNRLEDPAGWNRRPAAELCSNLLALGISADATVVLYGRDTVGQANEKWPGRRAGQTAAIRAALLLNYAGVRDVRVLDGGYDGWVLGGNPLETVSRSPQPVSSFGVEIPRRGEFIVDIDEAKSILAAEDAVLVSVRSWREQSGRTSGYGYIDRAGRIAGDVWGGGGSDAQQVPYYRNVDNTMRAYPEVAARWQDAGITPNKRVAFYCGTGWRASEAWFHAFLMGWPQIAVYDGGWLEWTGDPSNTIEVGEETESSRTLRRLV